MIIKEIKYNIDDFSYITQMSDFYEKTGILDICTDGLVKSVEQIHMNRHNCEKLEYFMIKNYKKNKKLKRYSKKYAEHILALDWANYSPASHESVDENTIYILDEKDNWRDYF